MPTFQYAKLVRDNIPGWHTESGHTVKGRQLTGNELRAALIAKLHEEADEISGTQTHEELIEEIADVQQIVNDLCAAEGISSDALKAVVQKKAARKGGFVRGEYIDTVTIPNEDDEWVAYCRKQPEKYPEV